MKNNILYSPWRIQYILSKKDTSCIFCLNNGAIDDEKHYIIYRTSLSYVILNTYPYSNGHIMVIPNKHVKSLSELTSEELSDLFQLVQLSERVLYNIYSPEGINVGINIGKAAGAGIDSHLHVHLLPRWSGDTNFMTTIGGTRVIPEELQATFSLLKEGYKNV
jgi:ATP adenylyltransferase